MTRFIHLAVLAVLATSATGFGTPSFVVTVYEDFFSPEGSGYAELQKKADELCQSKSKKGAIRVSNLRFSLTPRYYPTGNNISANFICE